MKACDDVDCVFEYIEETGESICALCHRIENVEYDDDEEAWFAIIHY